MAVVTGITAIHNLNDYIPEHFAVPSDEAFLYYKTGKHCNSKSIKELLIIICHYITAGIIFLSIFTGFNLLNLMTCVYLIVGALQASSFLFECNWIS